MSFALVRATSLEEGKFWIQTRSTLLQINTLCHILLEGVSKYKNLADHVKNIDPILSNTKPKNISILYYYSTLLLFLAKFDMFCYLKTTRWAQNGFLFELGVKPISTQLMMFQEISVQLWSLHNPMHSLVYNTQPCWLG